MVNISIQDYGLYATHDLMCWICNENKAVYNMSPVWVFQPCYECNREIGGVIERKHKWWKRQSRFRGLAL